MKKSYRRGINLTQKQAEMLDQFAEYSDNSLNETVRQFIDVAANRFVREILIWTKKDSLYPAMRIVLKDANVLYFKRFKGTGEIGDWISTFAIGMTVDEAVNWLTETKNCGYKEYVVKSEDTEIIIDDIKEICIETMDGDKKWY